VKNLLFDFLTNLPDELVEVLDENQHVRIERIVSNGHASPDGFWYDQERNEWVTVLRGAARLRFEGEEKPLVMGPGDFVNIPAHKKHRVDWTTPDEPTVWLSIHYLATTSEG